MDEFDRLMGALEAEGGGGLALPGLDDPISSGTYVRLILDEARERGWEFGEAWASAINRLQVSGPTGDLALGREIAEDRMLLEEIRPQFQAAYEGRRPEPIERSRHVVAVWDREGSPRSQVSTSARRRLAA